MIEKSAPAAQRAKANKKRTLPDGRSDLSRAIAVLKLIIEYAPTKRCRIGFHGSAVPDLDFTSEMSALLMKPSVFTSSRKLALVTAFPDCDLV
jgi:hypothetical protein